MTRELNELVFTLQPTNNQLVIKNPTHDTFSMRVPTTSSATWDDANNALLARELYLYFLNRGTVGPFFVGGYERGYEKTLAIQCKLSALLPPMRDSIKPRLEPTPQDEFAFERALEILAIPKGQFNKRLANGLTLAHHFALLGRVDCLRVFLQMGGGIHPKFAGSSEITTDDDTQKIDRDKLPIHYACIAGHPAVIELIAQFIQSMPDSENCQLDPDETDSPTYFKALSREDRMRYILFAKSVDGCQPVHYAALFRHSDCIEMLSKYGADLDAQKVFGYRPIHLAAMQGHDETVDTLIRCGADANATAKDPNPKCMEYPGSCGFLGMGYAVIACKTAAKQAIRAQSTAAHFAARSGSWLNVLNVLVNHQVTIKPSVLDAVPALKPLFIMRVTDLDRTSRAAMWANTYYMGNNETQDYRMWIRGQVIGPKDPRFQALLDRRKECREYIRSVLKRNQGRGNAPVVPTSTSGMHR